MLPPDRGARRDGAGVSSWHRPCSGPGTMRLGALPLGESAGPVPAGGGTVAAAGAGPAPAAFAVALLSSRGPLAGVLAGVGASEAEGAPAGVVPPGAGQEPELEGGEGQPIDLVTLLAAVGAEAVPAAGGSAAGGGAAAVAAVPDASAAAAAVDVESAAAAGAGPAAGVAASAAAGAAVPTVARAPSGPDRVVAGAQAVAPRDVGTAAAGSAGGSAVGDVPADAFAEVAGRVRSGVTAEAAARAPRPLGGATPADAAQVGGGRTGAAVAPAARADSGVAVAGGAPPTAAAEAEAAATAATLATLARDPRRVGTGDAHAATVVAARAARTGGGAAAPAAATPADDLVPASDLAEDDAGRPPAGAPASGRPERLGAGAIAAEAGRQGSLERDPGRPGPGGQGGQGDQPVPPASAPAAPAARAAAGTVPAPRPEAWAAGAPLVDRVVHALQLSAARDGSEIRVRVEPEGLGHIDVRVQLREDGVRVVVVAEHEATRALISSQQHLLEAALARTELRLSGFTVGSSLGEESGRFAGAERDQAGGAGPDGGIRTSETAAGDDEAGLRPAVAPGRLSVRV